MSDVFIMKSIDEHDLNTKMEELGFSKILITDYSASENKLIASYKTPITNKDFNFLASYIEYPNGKKEIKKITSSSYNMNPIEVYPHIEKAFILIGEYINKELPDDNLLYRKKVKQVFIME